jgi:hypothetical protein
LYSLRAELYALRGEKAKAQSALMKAWDHGWRTSWRARHDPFMEGVKIPEAK